MENITEFKEKTDMLLKKIYKVIDGNDIFITLSALWTAEIGRASCRERV